MAAATPAWTEKRLAALRSVSVKTCGVRAKKLIAPEVLATSSVNPPTLGEVRRLAIAAWFGRVVIYEDHDLRGRAPGEMRELIAAAMRMLDPGGRFVLEVVNGERTISHFQEREWFTVGHAAVVESLGDAAEGFALLV